MNENILDVIDAFSAQKVLVLGEAMLDSYLIGSSDRLCREAPVPVVAIKENVNVPGGAANTAFNAHGMGGKIFFLTVVGDDEEGSILSQTLRREGITTDHIIRDPQRRTLSKQRIVAGSQMLVRFDQGTTDTIDSGTEKALIDQLVELVPQCDAVIVSDYDYGILTPNVMKTLAKLQKKDRKLIVVDSKRPQMFRDIRPYAVKPNYLEAQQLLELEEVETDAERILQIKQNGKRILGLTGAEIAALTLDQNGALIFSRAEKQPYRTYANPQPNSNAAGAGDTFTSALALSLAAGAHLENSAELASAAASIVVAKDGTAVCYAEELRSHFSTNEKFISDIFQMTARMTAYQRAGQRIVFTNGCFDILHRGHIMYLNRAKSLGDILVVGLNSDASVRRLKGVDRPINSLEDRVLILTALSCVDHIVSFDEDTPHGLIEQIRPNIFAKGGDYTRETLPEAPLVEKLGGEVKILPYLENHSTTQIIQRIREMSADD